MIKTYKTKVKTPLYLVVVQNLPNHQTAFLDERGRWRTRWLLVFIAATRTLLDSH